MFRRVRPERIPLALAAAFVAVCSVVTVWNLTVAAAFPRLVVRNWSPLYGLIEEAPTSFSVASFVRGEDQTKFSRRLGATLPIYAPAVRIRNQIEYSVFGVPNAPSVVFGRDKHLYQRTYIDEYCGRAGEANGQAIADWAEKIKDIQDYATLHGKAFAYLITPSKAAAYPEYLPDNVFCPALLRGSTNKLPPYRDALETRRVRYIDGATLMATERGRHGIEVFPAGGTHWNALGASLAATQLLSVVKAEAHHFDLDGIDLAWRETHSPQGTDRDLVNMLNLYWFDTDYPVPEIAYRSKSDHTCRPAKIMEVGGSFLEQINVALRGSRCPPEISYWFYWNFAHVFYQGDKRRSEPPRDDTRVSDLTTSDVILLEENESILGMTDHLNALHSLVVAADRAQSASADR
jgi:alginate O-acetyltransferase complex protein AlgJ